MPPSPTDTADALALADVVETVIKAAIGPLVARVKALETLGGRETMPGPIGPQGPAGADGIGFDDYALDYDGERTITHRWTRGDRTVETVIKLPAMIYRGVYVMGKFYERGDCVTWAGSLWHANADTTTRPGDGPAWTMAVKRGKDAR